MTVIYFAGCLKMMFLLWLNALKRLGICGRVFCILYSNHFYFVCVSIFRGAVVLCFVMYLAVVYVIVELLFDQMY